MVNSRVIPDLHMGPRILYFIYILANVGIKHFYLKYIESTSVYHDPPLLQGQTVYRSEAKTLEYRQSDKQISRQEY